MTLTFRSFNRLLEILIFEASTVKASKKSMYVIPEEGLAGYFCIIMTMECEVSADSVAHSDADSILLE